MGFGEVSDALDGAQECDPSGRERMADDMRKQEAQDPTPISARNSQ